MSDRPPPETTAAPKRAKVAERSHAHVTRLPVITIDLLVEGDQSKIDTRGFLRKILEGKSARDESKRRRWNYAQLLADAERVASVLLDRFNPGEHVAVWADNIPGWVLLQYGCAIAGMILVTVNPGYKLRKLEYVLKQSEAVALLSPSGNGRKTLAFRRRL